MMNLRIAKTATGFTLVAVFLCLSVLLSQTTQAEPPVIYLSTDDDEQPAKVSTPKAQPASTTTSTQSANFQQNTFVIEQMDMMMQELQMLRGMVEEQSNEIERLKQAQIDQYQDVDRRIKKLATQSTAVGAATGVAATTTAKPKQTKPTTTVKPTGSESTDEISAKAAYNVALKQAKARNLDAADIAFNDFVVRFPDSALVPNAYYWLGEVYVSKGEMAKARDAFSLVTSDYPKSHKAPDSTYKLAVVYYKLGEVDKAKALFKKTIKSFPNTSAAKLSQTYLKKIQ